MRQPLLASKIKAPLSCTCIVFLLLTIFLLLTTCVLHLEESSVGVIREGTHVELKKDVPPYEAGETGIVLTIRGEHSYDMIAVVDFGRTPVPIAVGKLKEIEAPPENNIIEEGTRVSLRKAVESYDVGTEGIVTKVVDGAAAVDFGKGAVAISLEHLRKIESPRKKKKNVVPPASHPTSSSGHGSSSQDNKDKVETMQE